MYTLHVYSFFFRINKLHKKILYKAIGMLCHWITVSKYLAYTIYRCGVTHLIEDINYVNSFHNIVHIGTSGLTTDTPYK
jgi:hypothetical protein